MTTAATMTAVQAEDAAVQLEHEFIAIVRDEIGMHEAMATLIAQAIVRGLRQRQGGREMWIPAPDKSARNAAIRRDFNGANLHQLMVQHGLSRSRIYEIVGERATYRPPGSTGMPKSPV